MVGEGEGEEEEEVEEDQKEEEEKENGKRVIHTLIPPAITPHSIQSLVKKKVTELPPPPLMLPLPTPLSLVISSSNGRGHLLQSAGSKHLSKQLRRGQLHPDMRMGQQRLYLD